MFVWSSVFFREGYSINIVDVFWNSRTEDLSVHGNDGVAHRYSWSVCGSMSRFCGRRATPAMIEELRRRAREAEAEALRRRRELQEAQTEAFPHGRRWAQAPNVQDADGGLPRRRVIPVQPDLDYEVVDSDDDGPDGPRLVGEDVPFVPPAREAAGRREGAAERVESFKQTLRPRYVWRVRSSIEAHKLAHRTYSGWFAQTMALTKRNKALSTTGPHLYGGAVMRPIFEAPNWVLRWGLLVTRKVMNRFHHLLSEILKERKRLVQGLE